MRRERENSTILNNMKMNVFQAREEEVREHVNVGGK